MSTAPVILWFRQDLRLSDNPALNYACAQDRPIIPLFILDDENAADWPMGAASRVWLHHSLNALNKSLGHALCLKKEDAAKLLPALITQTSARGVYWNRCYEPWRRARDEKIKNALQEQGVEAKSFNGALLYEPWQTLKEDGTPYKVFTPFYKKGCLAKNGEPRAPEKPPSSPDFTGHTDSLNIDDLNLLPAVRWDKDMIAHWHPGEKGAMSALRHFLEHGLENYKQGRDHPDAGHVSRLSPHLHWGEISPRQVWHAARTHMAAHGDEQDGENFLSELGWREFSYSLLYYFHDLPDKPLQEKFSAFPWREDPKALRRWQQGRTGYPLVDAGMRELWATGYMHNRVRMVVASFLVKNLLIHWTEGEKWFWDTLVDADLANNSASWQWVAGCGADAAPYFRIFNPVLQSKKFDPQGHYIRRWVPELADMPDKYIHEPWAAPHYPENYPLPLGDHSVMRDRALAAYKQIKSS